MIGAVDDPRARSAGHIERLNERAARNAPAARAKEERRRAQPSLLSRLAAKLKRR